MLIKPLIVFRPIEMSALYINIFINLCIYVQIMYKNIYDIDLLNETFSYAQLFMIRTDNDTKRLKTKQST